MAITSPCFDKAKDKKFCDFIKDDTEETFQIVEPSFKESVFGSWEVEKKNRKGGNSSFEIVYKFKSNKRGKRKDMS